MDRIKLTRQAIKELLTEIERTSNIYLDELKSEDLVLTPTMIIGEILMELDELIHQEMQQYHNMDTIEDVERDINDFIRDQEENMASFKKKKEDLN